MSGSGHEFKKPVPVRVRLLSCEISALGKSKRSFLEWLRSVGREKRYDCVIELSCDIDYFRPGDFVLFFERDGSACPLPAFRVMGRGRYLELVLRVMDCLNERQKDYVDNAIMGAKEEHSDQLHYLMSGGSVYSDAGLGVIAKQHVERPVMWAGTGEELITSCEYPPVSWIKRKEDDHER